MSYFEDGECPIPQVYEQRKKPIVIYNHEGIALVSPKIPLGFDLTPDNEKNL